VYDPNKPTRVEIVIDTYGPNPDLLFAWIAGRAVRMVKELRQIGVDSELVSLDTDGVRRYDW
jgi:hypothetical protein